MLVLLVVELCIDPYELLVKGGALDDPGPFTEPVGQSTQQHSLVD